MKLSIIMPVRDGEKWVLNALQTIPERDDIETIVVDDCSTDGTYEVVSLFKRYSDRNIILLKNTERSYVGGSINHALDVAQGEYVVQLDSDDYLYTFEFNELLCEDHEEDLIFFCNQVNNGDIWSPEQTKGICDHVCFYKRSLIGETRHEDGKWGTGWNFHQTILNKPHTEYYSPRVVYHYNYPRENSNYDLGKRGLL